RLTAMPHSVRAELLTLLPNDQETFVRGLMPLLSILAVTPTLSDVPDSVPAPGDGSPVWMTVELAAIDAAPVAAPVPAAPREVAPTPVPSAAGGGGEDLAPVRVPKDVLIDLAVFAVASRPAALVEGPPAALRKRW